MTLAMQNERVYPSLTSNVELHRTGDGGIILVTDQEQAQRVDRVRSQGTYRVEGYIVDYLAKLNGQRDRAALDATVNEQFGPIFGPVIAERAWNWLGNHESVIEFHDSQLTEPAEVKLTGNDSAFYPMHCTFEIIETCNFACDHCYYSSAPWKKGRIEYDEAVEVMDNLAYHGVRVIELTGGECTIHPDFTRILEHASKTFELVGIITNGYRIGKHEPTAKAVCETPNLVAQVSIDAMGETHDKFRKHVHAFDNAVKAVEKLVAAGKVVRIASSISRDTISHIQPLYRLGKELGVAKHSFAPIASIGRGCNVSEVGPGAKDLAEMISAELAAGSADESTFHYSEIPSMAEAYEPPRNCGAGWRTFAIDYDGNVRACNYSRDSKKFGNILNEEYQDLFGQQANFYFHNAPSPGGRDCFGCDYYHNCRGCFVKAFMISETVYPECPWRRRWFPNMPLSLEEDRDGNVPLSDKKANLPQFSVEDSVHVCNSCSSESVGTAPEPATPPVGGKPEPVFVGETIGFGPS